MKDYKNFKDLIGPIVAGIILGISIQKMWHFSLCIREGSPIAIGSCGKMALRYLGGGLLFGFIWPGLYIFLNRLLPLGGRSPLVFTLMGLSFFPAFAFQSQAGFHWVIAIVVSLILFFHGPGIIKQLKNGWNSPLGILIIGTVVISITTELVFHLLRVGKILWMVGFEDFFYNLVLNFFILSAGYLVVARLGFCLVIGFFGFVGVAVAAGLKTKFTGLPLYPWDIHLILEAFLVIPHFWNLQASFATFGVVVIFIFGMWTVKWLNSKSLWPKANVNFRKRCSFFLFGLLASLSIFLPLKTSLHDLYPDFKGIRDRHINKGLTYFIAMGLKFDRNEKIPQDYTKEKMLNIAKIFHFEKPSFPRSGLAEVDKKNPNIVLYMMESLMDLNDLGVEFTNRPASFFESLQNGYTSGFLYVPVFGGLTANTEFEVLTGLSVRHLRPGLIAYYQIDRKIPSLATVFKKRGYSTHAFNGWVKAGFNWEKVYPLLGVDRLLAIGDDKKDAPKLYHYYSDSTLVDWILETIETKKEPIFSVVVTNSTHSPFDGIPKTEYFETNNIKNSHASSLLESYATLLKDADAQLKRLIEKIEIMGEPTVVVIYGDHLPGLDEVFSRLPAFKVAHELKLKRRYRVPIVFWTSTNMNLKKGKDISISSNFLSHFVLQKIGIENLDWFSLFVSLRSYFNIYSTQFYETSSEDFFQTKANLSEEHRRQAETYELIQYDTLSGAGFLKKALAE